VSEQISSRLVTYAVFLFTLGIIGISILSISFPAFIITSTYDYPIEIDPFEVSPWLTPIIISTVILLSIGFLYLKKKLPCVIHSSIEYILNFEISKKVAIIIKTMRIKKIIHSFHILFTTSVVFPSNYLISHFLAFLITH
jgi:hypothetical protein